ncbi:sperm acrosome-associated protein 7 isoform X1 [Papio anubis]|uniref:sperm acrosome-associated protein 7 isoform X1 n=1 Tax=Papio anubis TaxID=9555 RepID=UPI0012ADA35E|nr:sperm acrosome-associated protein 7 isoform X1 [Papio anubis]
MMSQVLTFHSVLETKGGKLPTFRTSFAFSWREHGSEPGRRDPLLCPPAVLLARNRAPAENCDSRSRRSQNSWICQKMTFFTHLWEGDSVSQVAGSTTEIPFSSKHEDVPELLDEILVQEILDMNKTTWTEMPSTASTLSTIHAGIDENYQAGGSENYHELLENLQFSSGTEDKVSSDEASANANLHGDPSENYSGPQVSPGSEKTVSSKEKTNSKNTQYENLSFLDKILQNIGRSSGNIFHNEQQRTSSQRRSRDSQ